MGFLAINGRKVYSRPSRRSRLSTRTIEPAQWKPSPPDRDILVDVIVPFCSADSAYLEECLESLRSQSHCTAIMHVIADGCEFPRLDWDRYFCLQYSTYGSWGPYKITNAVVAGGNCEADWLALQDADDVSHPDRLWRQIQTLIHHHADMISSASENFLDAGSVDDEFLQKRVKQEPVITAGRVFHTAPRGSCVNTTRTMRRAYFESLNGFAPELCSMDFEFDNRSRFCQGIVLDDPAVLGRRRLHSKSLTGGSHRMGTPARDHYTRIVEQNRDAICANPTLETARSLGGLDSGKVLRPSY
jgi:hypothetical protein